MAVVAEQTKVKAALLLNNGSTATGQVKTLSLNLGPISPAYNPTNDDQKVVNIANALYGCLDLSVYSLERTITSELSDD